MRIETPCSANPHCDGTEKYELWNGEVEVVDCSEHRHHADPKQSCKGLV